MGRRDYFLIRTCGEFRHPRPGSWSPRSGTASNDEQAKTCLERVFLDSNYLHTDDDNKEEVEVDGERTCVQFGKQ
jgi:hypothetical protein